MMNLDTFLKIGSQHSVCEDYVLSGEYGALKYIILSDGCSSSPNTEMGARILCYLARQYIRYRFEQNSESSLDYYDTGNWIIYNAEMAARQLGLPRTCLDATLLISFVDFSQPIPSVNIFIYGDGFVVLVPKDGPLEMYEIEFAPDNMPFYLSYNIDPERFEMYHKKKVSKFLSKSTKSEQIFKNEFAYDANSQFQFFIDNYKTILLFSDGLKSFIKQDPTNREILNPLDIIEGLISFKNIKGKFLQRRVSKALKSLAENNIVHYDDLSIGAYINEEHWDGNIRFE